MGCTRRGVTLMEMLIVVTLIGLLVGVSFPSVSAGVDSLRLLSASDATASFLNSALNRAERRQQAIEVSFAPEESKFIMRSTDPSFVRELNLPDGVKIARLEPDVRRVLLLPGGSVPRLVIELENRRRARKRVSVDPITGVPEVRNVEDEEGARR